MELVNDLFDLIDICTDLFSRILDFSEFCNDVFAKHLLLSLNVLVRHRAEVEQVEDIDLEYLEVRYLLKGVLELCLLPAQVCPQRVAQLCQEVLGDEGLPDEVDLLLGNLLLKLATEREVWRGVLGLLEHW